MMIVVSYDIAEDRRRGKVLNELKNHGTRVQESVFECELNNRRFLRLKVMLKKIVLEKEDSIRYYIICRQCLSRIEYLGKSKS